MNERRQSIDTKAEMTVKLELSDKYCKVAIIKILQWTIINTAEAHEKTVSAKKKKKIPVRNRKYKKVIILVLKSTTEILKFNG